MENFNSTDLCNFHSWENRTCKTRILFKLTQTSKNNKRYIKQNLQIKAVGDGPAGQAVDEPEFAIFP